MGCNIASKDKEFRFLLIIIILLCIIFLGVEIMYNFKMERFSRKLHYKFEHGDLDSTEVDKNGMQSVILLISVCNQ